MSNQWVCPTTGQMPGGLMSGCNRYQPTSDQYERAINASNSRFWGGAPREMTAADLGLRCSCDRTNCAQCGETYRKSFVGPYAFWLGAEG